MQNPQSKLRSRSITEAILLVIEWLVTNALTRYYNK